MAFVLENNEPLSIGIRRMAKEQLGAAIYQLQQNKNKHKAIHETRKRLKEVRALLRLIRDELGDETYREHNNRLREIQGRLSELRDAAVAVETVDKLKNHFQDNQTEKLFTTARKKLLNKKKNLSRKYFSKEGLIKKMVRELKKANKTVDQWPVESNSFDAISMGLNRVYRRGYDARILAYKKPTAENFHNWRKRVKYLWHQVQVLQPLWAAMLSKLEEEIHRLSDVLGSDHDLAILKNKLEQNYIRFNNEGESAFFISVINKQRQNLAMEAWPMAKRIYAFPPVIFTNAMGSYWHAWQQEKA